MTDVFKTTEEATTPPVTVDPVVEKRLNDKDAFIEQLKRETAELREEVKKRTLADQQLDELRAEITRLKEENQPREATAPALSESSIRTLVEQTITAAEQTRTAGSNIQEANTTLVGILVET
jgi:predicted RNase H-like nuclease (RuvC/YqgF family)